MAVATGIPIQAIGHPSLNHLGCRLDLFTPLHFSFEVMETTAPFGFRQPIPQVSRKWAR